MRIADLRIYGKYFEFRLVPTMGEQDESGDYASVLYDEERNTINCSCCQDGCRHSSFIHEKIIPLSDQTLQGYLIANTQGRAQTITMETVVRLRGAFAREYNISNDVLQYQSRSPLGWQGVVNNKQMRVIQRTGGSYMVYELGRDQWDLVLGNGSPDCQSESCRGPGLCAHEYAVITAIQEWKANGMWNVYNVYIDRGAADQADITRYSMVVDAYRVGLGSISEDKSPKKQKSEKTKAEKQKPHQPTSRFKEIDL